MDDLMQITNMNSILWLLIPTWRLDIFDIFIMRTRSQINPYEGATTALLENSSVTGLEFDNQGIYIESVTRSGCLTVHDFETLYCQIKVGPGKELDVVRWNPTNQNEVACTSRKEDKVLIFDISYMSSKPTEELKTKQKLTIFGRKLLRYLSDIAITNDGDPRIFSPDTLGTVHVWDRRASVFPCTELSANRHESFNSIQIYADNQAISGAGKEGIIHIWDLRGGQNSTAFQSRKDRSVESLAISISTSCTDAAEDCISPDIHIEIGSFIESVHLQLIPLQAQTEIVPKEIHSINVNPSSPHQLAFHLDDGWSGVLDIYKSEVNHVHCPPPAWLGLIVQKPSWLPTSSIYVVGSMSEKGIHVLDFHPSSSEDSQRKENRDKFYHNNKFVSLSETITNCAAHPLNNMIVAGTQRSSLLLVGQRYCSYTTDTVEDEM